MIFILAAIEIIMVAQIRRLKDNDRHQPLVGCMDLLALFMKGKCHGESQSKRRHKATGN